MGGKLDKVIFPAPSPSYYAQEDFEDNGGKLIYVPKAAEESKNYSSGGILSCVKGLDTEDNPFDYTDTFPCYYIPCLTGSDKVVVYFHGNGEDLGYATDVLREIVRIMKCHAIALEYPAYGVCFEEKADAFEIKKRALSLQKYLSEAFGFKEKNIILYGRSIGSGVATYVASRMNPGLVILHSPYSSIGSVALQITKLYYIPKVFIKERFDSKNCIKNIKCPIYITHGKVDDIIPINEAEKLIEEIEKYDIPLKYDFWEGKGHNDMHMEDEVFHPALQFMEEQSFKINSKTSKKNLQNFELAKFIEDQSKAAF
ncbi:unnamed protein product [Moneuplotes crassus]|uniref:Dienelactone hydrolase domain-containing protein n=1 Tax=Euplotes crassus TaxID=5936 RepID=A0AAD1U9T8_EUPCR|nr:unnamed protein product [Moneuplotes crassus]